MENKIMKRYLELAKDAESALDLEQNYDFNEFIELFGPICKALGKPIGSDQIDSVTVVSSCIYITTSYVCRGYLDHDHLEVPLSIFESNDPVKAASIYHVESKLRKYEVLLASANHQVQSFLKITNELKQELAALKE